MPARDGGLVVYANYDNDDQGLVLAGNVKEVNDYIAKQIGMLGVPQKKAEAYDREMGETVRSLYRLNAVEA
jgi:hypothetical protein